MIVGLSGGIATGKSTICHHLVDFGLFVIDADIVARQVVEPHTKGLAEIVEAFGNEYLLPDGQLNRALLGQAIFTNDAMRQRLNDIVHPLVRERMWGQALEYVKGNPQNIVILDVPLLFEGKTDALADLTVLVYASKEVQVQRLMERNQLTRDEAMNRIHAQMSIEEKKTLADWVVFNTGDAADTIRLTQDLFLKLHNLAKAGAAPDGSFDRSVVTREEFY